MTMARAKGGRVIWGALCSLWIAGGCDSNGAVRDGGGDARSAPLCDRDGWCSALPTDFSGAPMLVGEELIASSVARPGAFLQRADDWQPIECPADSGVTEPPNIRFGLTSGTLALCGSRSYLWSPTGWTPIPWASAGWSVSSPTFALRDVLFFVASNPTQTIWRCSTTACDSFAPPALPVSYNVTRVSAESADNFTVLTEEGRAWRHTPSGWTEVATASVARPPEWPPTVGATCLADGRWVVCGSQPDAIGPFSVAQKTLTRVLLVAKFGEYVLFDGTHTRPLQATSLASFRRQYWPDFNFYPGPQSIQWVYPSSVDAVLDHGVERLFMGFVGAFPGEGTGAPHPRTQRVFTRLGDGPWESLGGDNLGWCSGVSASSTENVWVRCDTGVARFDGHAWQAVDMNTARDVCAMNDGSAIVTRQTATSYVAVLLRAGQPESQLRPAVTLLGCTHDDVFAVGDRIAHRSGGDWVEIDQPPGGVAMYLVGMSDFGLTVVRSSPQEAYVWDGARWQARAEASGSFYQRQKRVRAGSREWAVMGWTTGSLLYRDVQR